MKDFFTRYDHLIIPEPNSGCWLWLGGTTGEGYGHFYIDGQNLYAHRCAFEAVYGHGSLDGLICRHECDNPPCVNPDHLLKGTHHDNAMDSVRRGRAHRAVGENSGRAVLSTEDVFTIRDLASRGISVAEVSRRFPSYAMGSMLQYEERTGVISDQASFPFLR